MARPSAGNMIIIKNTHLILTLDEILNYNGSRHRSIKCYDLISSKIKDYFSIKEIVTGKLHSDTGEIWFSHIDANYESDSYLYDIREFYYLDISFFLYSNIEEFENFFLRKYSGTVPLSISGNFL